MLKIFYTAQVLFSMLLVQKRLHINSLNCFDKKSEPSEDWCFFIGITQNTMNFEHINIYSFMWNLNKKANQIIIKKSF